MSYVIIQNKGELPIWGMRLLGLSNKNEAQIGQFGTGLKESIALLARLGALPVIYSGTCRIDFSVREIDGQQEICFKLSERRDRFAAKRWHGLGMHPNFSHADWNDPWMVFRELICNALDESGVDDLYHDITSNTPEGVEGCTRVYVPTSQDIIEAYSSVHQKLLTLSDYEIRQAETGVGRAIAKRKSKKLQVFHRGVWVQRNDDPSLFDYELDCIKLNESRSADWYDVNRRVAQLIAAYNLANARCLLLQVLKEERTDLYELSILETASLYQGVDTGDVWREAFHGLFGNDAVITDNDKFFYERLDQIGKKPVVIQHAGLMSLLKACGVPHAHTVLTRDQQSYQRLENPSDAAQAIFDECWAMFVDHGLTNGREKPGLMMFEQRAGQSVMVYGEYRKGVCYINMACVGSLEERRTCVEEIAHHVTDAGDNSTELQHFLVAALTKIAFEDARNPA